MGSVSVTDHETGACGDATYRELADAQIGSVQVGWQEFVRRGVRSHDTWILKLLAGVPVQAWNRQRRLNSASLDRDPAREMSGRRQLS